MPLALADIDKDYTITRIAGKPDVKAHLETLGFVPGAAVRLISVVNGDVIVNIKNSRIAISEAMARKIYV